MSAFFRLKLSFRFVYNVHPFMQIDTKNILQVEYNFNAIKILKNILNLQGKLRNNENNNFVYNEKSGNIVVNNL